MGLKLTRAFTFGSELTSFTFFPTVKLSGIKVPSL